MNISAPFIKRPVGTSLLTIALALAGCLGYSLLPVSPLPQVDFPTIQVSANLPSNPNYRKVNPADAPIMLLSLTSDTIEIRKLYDLAYSVLQQKISQVDGVGQVIVGGSSLPAVRVELNPQAVNKYGVGLEHVRTALGAANANRPKGQLSNDEATRSSPTSTPTSRIAVWKSGS